jgi:hypothetical protein
MQHFNFIFRFGFDDVCAVFTGSAGCGRATRDFSAFRRVSLLRPDG